MLSNESHVAEARSFSEEMAVAKDNLVLDQEEVKAATGDTTPF